MILPATEYIDAAANVAWSRLIVLTTVAIDALCTLGWAWIQTWLHEILHAHKQLAGFELVEYQLVIVEVLFAVAVLSVLFLILASDIREVYRRTWRRS